MEIFNVEKMKGEYCLGVRVHKTLRTNRCLVNSTLLCNYKLPVALQICSISNMSAHPSGHAEAFVGLERFNKLEFIEELCDFVDTLRPLCVGQNLCHQAWFTLSDLCQFVHRLAISNCWVTSDHRKPLDRDDGLHGYWAWLPMLNESLTSQQLSDIVSVDLY